MAELPKILSPLLRSANPPEVDLTKLDKNYYQVVVYGRGGVGKTHFGLDGAPKPIEWVDCDERANTIAYKFTDGRVAHLYKPVTHEEIENSIAWAIFRLREHFEKTGERGTMIIDSYTALKRKIKADYNIKLGRAPDAQTSIQEKSQIRDRMEKIIDNLKKSEMNLVITAEQGVKIISEKNEETQKDRITDVMGGVPKNEDELMYAFDILCWIYSQDEKKVGMTAPVTRYYYKIYKSSTSRLPQEVTIAPKEDITWGKLIPEIEGLRRIEIKKIRGEFKQ